MTGQRSKLVKRLKRLPETMTTTWYEQSYILTVQIEEPSGSSRSLYPFPCQALGEEPDGDRACLRQPDVNVLATSIERFAM